MARDPETDQLSRRYRRTVWVIGLAAVLALAALIGREFWIQIQRGLELRASHARERLVAVEAVVRSADVHVTAMRTFLEREFALAGPARDPRLRDLASRQDSGVVDLLGPPSVAETHRSGVLMGVPERAKRRPGFAAEAETALELFRLQGPAHVAQPFLKWSYFFSEARDLIAIHPWADLDGFFPSRSAADFDAYYGYDVYRLAVPAANPDLGAVWVPVYFDAGNAGLMVSHNAPVMVAGALRGMVGTDVLLTSLSDLLSMPDLPESKIVIVDQAGSIVADTDGVAAAAREITRQSALLPAAPDTIPRGSFARLGNVYATASPVAGVPWTAVTLVPVRTVVLEAAGRVLPYLVYLLALAAALAGAFMMIGRRYVRPAFALVRAIEQQAAGRPAVPVTVPPAWTPWIDRVLGLFAELRRTMERLHAAETKSAAIIDVALDAVVTTDDAGRVVDFNPAAVSMFGRSLEEARGQPIGSLIVPPHLAAAHEAGMERHRRTGRSHVLGRRVELDALHASGRIFPVELQIHQLTIEDEVRYAAYIRDLTEPKAAAAAIAEQQEKLHQAEKLTAMGSLLAGLAHELNNPLAVVTAQTSLLEEIAPDATTRGRATKIRVAAERCGRIVRTFLAMARKQAPQRRSVDLKTVVEGALEILAYGLRSNGVEVTADIAPDLPPVEADPDQLSQVVVNVIVNAQQAFGDRVGERRIFIRLTPSTTGGVTLVIADNGPGIPETVKARVFEAFFTTKPVGVGTGIGLAVCRSIVEAHGGTIRAGDRPGGGAEFVIDLPSGRAAPVAAAEAAHRPAHGPGRDVLVLDDEQEVAEALGAFLEMDGHRVRLAGTIADGLATMEAAAPDVVFCDLRMPGGGGTAFWSMVAARRPDLAARFVFVTGDMVAGPETVRRAADGRPVRILEKPFDRADIRKALEDVFAAEDAS